MRLKKAEKDFPGGTVDQNPPASTGDVGSTPGLGRFHVLWATEAREPQLLEPAALDPVSHSSCSPCAYSLCSATRESPAMKSLCTATE